MLRSRTFVAALLACAAGLAMAGTQDDDLTVSGKVTAVAGKSITIDVEGEEWDFVVNEHTRISAKGASHASREAEKWEKSTGIKDFVKVGSRVSVTYEEMGDELLAAQIRVLTAPRNPS